MDDVGMLDVDIGVLFDAKVKASRVTFIQILSYPNQNWFYLLYQNLLVAYFNNEAF